MTAGFGARAGYSYFERLGRNPPDEFAGLADICLRTVVPGLHSTNLAVNGSTSLHHARSQLPKLRPQPTNVLGIVVMTTGGNDLIHNCGRSPPREGGLSGATVEQARPWIDRFRIRLDQMITTITDAASKFPFARRQPLGIVRAWIRIKSPKS